MLQKSITEITEADLQSLVTAALPHEARAELAERLIASLAEDVSPEITEAQLAEVRRRIAEVESGEAQLIPGDEVLARVRHLLAERSTSS